MTHSLEVRIARHEWEYRAAYKLLYDTFWRMGYCEPNEAGMLLRDAFMEDGSTTLVCYQGYEVAGTMTVLGGYSAGRELDEVYPEAMQKIRSNGSRIVECTGLAALPASRIHRGSVFLHLTRFMFQFVEWSGFTDIVTKAHPDIGQFYEQYLCAEPIGEIREIASVRNNPGVGFHVNVERAKDQIRPTLAKWFFAGYRFSHEAFEIRRLVPGALGTGPSAG